MVAINNMDELKNALMSEIISALQEARFDSIKDAQNELDKFYTVPQGTTYVRTYKLRKSLRDSKVSKINAKGEFYIWLDQTYKYKMPNEAFIKKGYASYYSTPMVLEAAENHHSHIRGLGGFWERSQIKIEQNLTNALRKRFKEV